MATAFRSLGVSFRHRLIKATAGLSLGALSLGALALGSVSFGSVSLVTFSAHAEGKPPAATLALDPEFTRAIKEGDRQYLDGKYSEAAAAYEKAIARQKHNPEGYARLAAAQRQQGQYDEAIATLGRGLETSSTVTERAKLVFLQADIQERRNALEKAQARWAAYLELSGGAAERTIDLDAPEQEAPTPVVEGETVYPTSALERQGQVEAAMKRYEDYAPVKERIRKREQAADAKARGSSR